MFSFVLTLSIFMYRDEVDGRLTVLVVAKDRGVVNDDQALHNGNVVTTNSKPVNLRNDIV
jgi:hypothetical protein